MRNFSLIIRCAILIVYSNLTFGESYHCDGKTEWGDMDIRVSFYIILPDKIDSTVSLPTAHGENKTLPVGRGEIEIQEIIDKKKMEKRTHDLYITSLDTGIITGMIVTGIQIYVLRFSPKAHTFTYFDSFLERLIVGNCE